MDQNEPISWHQLKVKPSLGLRPRLAGEEWPAAVYAIGDVHGCFAELRRLHERIIEDAASFDGNKLIVCLGDYIDRGPDSAKVIDFLRQPLPAGFQRICIAGNHEAMMLDYCDAQSTTWLDNGGLDMLVSYGISAHRFLASSRRERMDLLRAHVPEEHIDWMHMLPSMVCLPGVCFVHAGLRPNVPLAAQSERDLLWIRPRDGVTAGMPETLVVHGHTPAADPVVTTGRICVDTAAFVTGTLTAVRLTQTLQIKLINVTADEIIS